jgi:hypothetical protein
MRKLLVLLPLAFAGCATAHERQVVGLDQVPPGSICTASGALNSFVGQTASAALGAQMMAAARATKLRWVPYGGVVTMDYSPTRLTVRLDQQSRVESATCG